MRNHPDERSGEASSGGTASPSETSTPPSPPKGDAIDPNGRSPRSTVAYVLAALVLIVFVGAWLNRRGEASPGPTAALSSNQSLIIGAISGGPYPDVEQSATTQPAPASPPTAMVPDVVNLRASKAGQTLTQLGFLVIVVSKGAPQKKGTVIAEKPAVGQALSPGSSVRVIVSLGWPTLPAWNPFTPLKVEVAMKRIRKAGFRIKGVTWRYSLRSPDRLIGTIPDGGKHYAPGTKVELFGTKLPACTPGYSPCLPPHVIGSDILAQLADYNCANGGTTAPYYAYGLIHVTGSDPYRLDGDNDHWGCE